MNSVDYWIWRIGLENELRALLIQIGISESHLTDCMQATYSALNQLGRPCKGCGVWIRGQWNYCQKCIDESGHSN